MASILNLEKQTLDLQKRLCKALQKEFPEGASVLVQVRTGQKNLSRATVLRCWYPDVGMVRVRLQTAKGRALNVHWTNVFPE